MPKKITNITPEQAARFNEWSRRWIDIGLSTEPADFDKAINAALRAYKLCNLNRPMVILRTGSPYAATIGGAIAWAMLRELPGSQVESQVKSQVGAQVRSQVWSQVESQVGAQVGAQVWSQVESQVGAQVGAQVWSQVGAQVESQVGSQVGLGNYRGGAFWSSWCAYVSFMRDVLGLEDAVLDRFAIDEDITKSCGWVWWHENILSISDRPAVINRDERGRLHCSTGPSISYRDGWSLWHWHGTAVSQDIIEDRSSITTTRIDAETNAEVRRVMIDLYGQSRYLLDSGAKLVGQDSYGKLWRKEIDGDEPLVMVEVLNSTPEPDGSVKTYFLRVPPQMERPQQAIAWTFGITEKEYQPAIET